MEHQQPDRGRAPGSFRVAGPLRRRPMVGPGRPHQALPVLQPVDRALPRHRKTPGTQHPRGGLFCMCRFKEDVGRFCIRFGRITLGVDYPCLVSTEGTFLTEMIGLGRKRGAMFWVCMCVLRLGSFLTLKCLTVSVTMLRFSSPVALHGVAPPVITLALHTLF